MNNLGTGYSIVPSHIDSKLIEICRSESPLHIRSEYKPDPDEWKTCPFCYERTGKVQSKTYSRFDLGLRRVVKLLRFQVVCMKCYARGPISHVNEDDAKKQWSSAKIDEY